MKFYRETKTQRTKIGPIPKEWEIVQIRDVCEVIGGGTPSTKNQDYWDGNIPFVTPTDVTDLEEQNFDFLEKASRSITEKGQKNCSANLLPIGSILLTSRATIGYCVINNVPVTTNQGFANLVCSKKANNRFILYLMRFVRRRLNQMGAGSTYAEISRTMLGKLRIPLPPIPEQEAIAEILSTSNEAIMRSNAVIAKTKRLKQGLMQELLTNGIRHHEFKNTGIGKIPKEWQVMRIEEIAETSSGGTPSRNKEHYFNGDILWVKSGELADNTIYDTDERISKEGLENSSAKMFSRGTLLVAMYGATVGKTAVLGVDATTNQAVCAVLPNDKLFDSNYLQNYIILKRNRLISMSSGGAQPNISQEIIKIFRVPLPPLSEQQKIAEILFAIDKKIDMEKKEKEKMTRIKKGLMEFLLTGKLRVKGN